jgi:hypothetical protein
MRAPTMKFSLDVATLLKLQEAARRRNVSVSRWLQELVNETVEDIQFAPQGRKDSNTHDEEHRNR